MFTRAKVLGAICLLVLGSFLSMYFVSALDVITIGRFGDTIELDKRVKFEEGRGVAIGTNLPNNSLTFSLPVTVIRDIETVTGANIITEGEVIGGTTPARGIFTDVGIGIPTPNSLLQVRGPIATAVTIQVTHYLVTATDSIIIGNPPTANIIFTLPTAVGIAGREYVFKNINATWHVIVDGHAAETIDGVLTRTLRLNDCLIIKSDGANWIVSLPAGIITEGAPIGSITPALGIFTRVGIGIPTPNYALEVRGIRGSSVNTHTIPNDGVAGHPPTYILLPTTSYVEIINNDPDGAHVTMSEVGMASGAEILLVNMSGIVVNFIVTPGVTQLAGSFAMGRFGSLKLVYAGDRWVEISRSINH